MNPAGDQRGEWHSLSFGNPVAKAPVPRTRAINFDISSKITMESNEQLNNVDENLHESENKLVAERRRKLDTLRAAGFKFPNSFRVNAWAGDLAVEFADKSAEQLEVAARYVKVAGRMLAKRVMGKASFVQIQDMTGRLQIFLQASVLGDDYEAFKEWDVGDIVAAEGKLMRTKTGELSVRCSQLSLLTKSLRPLPEKWSGLTDTETRYRQRYVDLIVSPDSRRVFELRSRIVRFIRHYLDERRFLEVETPMMQLIPGGATARPFVTHHNALDMDLYLRVAPELFLKRLTVGGFDRIYEINRNFRNEGVSTRHNPEFTMLELYQAYAGYHDIMDLTEDLLRNTAQQTLGRTDLLWEAHAIDLGTSFRRWRLDDAVQFHNPEIAPEQLHDRDALVQHCLRLKIPIKKEYGWGKLLLEIFEKTVESGLIQPTFITAYPTEVSPLARANDVDPEITDRFELFVGGKEIANGFSELNDAEDQEARFKAQMSAKEAGDDEAMHFDGDYIRALEYGLPPTGGLGIGIDRLVMLLTNSASIRDVLLFPYMRPEK